MSVHDVQIVFEAALNVWKVIRGGRTLSKHKTQASAVRAGKRVALREQVELVTHAVDGQRRAGLVRPAAKDSYGDESPRKDTEH